MTVDGSRKKDDGSGNSWQFLTVPAGPWRPQAVPVALSAGNAEVGGAGSEPIGAVVS